MPNRHFIVNMSRPKLLIFPLKHSPPKVFPISVHVNSSLPGASAEVFHSPTPRTQAVSKLHCYHLSVNYQASCFATNYYHLSYGLLQ